MVDPESLKWIGTSEAAARIDISEQAVRASLSRLLSAGSPHVRRRRHGDQVAWEVTEDGVKQRIATGNWKALRPSATSNRPALTQPAAGEAAADIAGLLERLEDQQLRADLAVSGEMSARLEAKQAEIIMLRQQLQARENELMAVLAERDALRAEYRAVLAARATSL